MHKALSIVAAAAMLSAGCAGGGRSSFPEGLEPQVSFSGLYAVVTSGPAANFADLDIEISNPNDYPLTLVALDVRMTGDATAQLRPEYRTLQLEVPAGGMAEAGLQLEITDATRAVPVTPADVVGRSMPRAFRLVARVRFRTPYGTRQVQVKQSMTAGGNERRQS
jgi:hypothetical protein